MGLRHRRGLSTLLMLMLYGIADIKTSLPVDIASEEKGE